MVSQKSREVLTAIVSAIPSGLALDEAYEHQLDVWRESEGGMELIDGFNEIEEDKIQLLDIRHVLSGKYNHPSEEIFRFLYGTMNAAELCLNRNLDELNDSDDKVDAASVKDHDPPVWVQSAEDLAAIKVAEDELRKMGKDAILDAAAEAAEAVTHQARRAARADEQILFDLTDTRVVLGDELVESGVGLGANPPETGIDDGESARASDLVILRAPDVLPPMPQGAPLFQGAPRVLGEDDASELGGQMYIKTSCVKSF